ncbi:MAG: hypothetical protein CL930_06385 [Deltaproteobacteria bacterium]|nr:hypothetical protein [Deltaproteobacteria bacterium]
MLEVVEWVCLLLAIIAAWMSVRPAPPLDWERLWKVSLATVIRGQVEAAKGDQDAWWEQLKLQVPYNPVGRLGGAKLHAPSLVDIPVPALEGEQSLVERLSRMETPAERWVEMFHNDEAAVEALLSNPAELGSAYDPGTVMAPGIDWESIAQWSDTVQTSITRRLTDVIVVAVGVDSTPLQEAIPHVRVAKLDSVDADAILRLAAQAHDRLVLLASAEFGFQLVQTLHSSPELRDRVLAVVSMGVDFARDGRREWMNENFNHLAMDTELNRHTPYMSIVDVDPSNPGLDWSDQVFPEPEVPPSGWSPVQSIDLGPLPLNAQEPRLLARALWVLLCFRLSSR